MWWGTSQGTGGRNRLSLALVDTAGLIKSVTLCKSDSIFGQPSISKKNPNQLEKRLPNSNFLK